MRRILLIAALCAAIAGPARAGQLTHDPCPDLVNTTVTTVKQFSSASGAPDVLENLGFDGQNGLWVSDTTANAVYGLNASFDIVKTVSLPSPGALTLGLDGLMYANFGDAAVAAIMATGAAGVARFDPTNPVPVTYAAGMNMANGGIFDGDGNYYASNDVGDELTKVLPGGAIDEDWRDHVHAWGANGLAVRNGVLWSAITFDQRSSIVGTDLAAPHAQRTIQTTLGVASLQPAIYATPDSTRPAIGLKGLDDMTIGPDTRLWVVANGMGELLRVDPDTGDVCLVASGFNNPSSVRFARSFPGYSDSQDLFVTEFSGALKLVHLS